MTRNRKSGAELWVLRVLLLTVVLLPGVARADATYSFIGHDAFTSEQYSFSFTEPTVFTTSQAFATSLSIGSVVFTSGYYDAALGCYSFSTTQAPDCTLPVDQNTYFAAEFSGANHPGIFNALADSCEAVRGQPCVSVDTLTIATTVAATPEPSSWMLLGSGVLGVSGVVRRRLRG